MRRHLTFGRLDSDGRLMLDGRDLFQAPLLIPAHANEIIYSSAKAVPDAVFRLAGDPRMMDDGYFLNNRSPGMGQNRHEPMHSVEDRHVFQDRTFEHSQIAAGILEIHSQHKFPGPPRYPR